MLPVNSPAQVNLVGMKMDSKSSAHFPCKQEISVGHKVSCCTERMPEVEAEVCALKETMSLHHALKIPFFFLPQILISSVQNWNCKQVNSLYPMQLNLTSPNIFTRSVTLNKVVSFSILRMLCWKLVFGITSTLLKKDIQVTISAWKYSHF